MKAPKVHKSVHIKWHLIQDKIIKFMIRTQVRLFCPYNTTVACFYEIVASAADERHWMHPMISRVKDRHYGVDFPPEFKVDGTRSCWQVLCSSYLLELTEE